MEDSNKEGNKPSKPKKPIYKRVWFWIVGIIVLFIIIVNLGGGNNNKDQTASNNNTTKTEATQTTTKNTTQVESKKYSLDKFNQIQMGMTYDQVKGILSDGTETASSGDGDMKTVSYSWQNSDGGNISVDLQGGKVTSKAQAGLQSMDAKVTMAKYNKVQNGMTYDQVKAILGEGQLTSETQILDQDDKIYSWINFDGSNMEVTFQNGKVDTKAQFELK